jgi:hypothetical protein
MKPHNAPSAKTFGPTIEVLGGRTRFPRRPIVDGRMLIGAGSNCHLQLGGGIPMAHSVIAVKDGSATIEALAAEPWLLVNGSRVRSGMLANGDRIQIGPFLMSIHLPVADALLNSIDVPAVLDAERQAEASITSSPDLSAEELVDRLVTELTTAILAEQGAPGAASLLAEAAASEVDSIDSEQLATDVLAQLEALSGRIAERQRALEDSAPLVIPITTSASPDQPRPMRKTA